MTCNFFKCLSSFVKLAKRWKFGSIFSKTIGATTFWSGSPCMCLKRELVLNLFVIVIIILLLGSAIIIFYYWWPLECSKQVKMSNYWSLKIGKQNTNNSGFLFTSIQNYFCFVYLFLETTNLTLLLVYYILKANNNKKWLNNNKSRYWGWSIRKQVLSGSKTNLIVARK